MLEGDSISFGLVSQPSPRRKILVAVAWPYASGPRHIGHVAGFGVPSDIFARYHRLRGNDVLMVSGTDEHGTPVMVAADREGVSPRELADRYNERRSATTCATSGSRTTSSRARRRRTTTASRRTSSGRSTSKGYVVEQTTLGAFSATTGHTLPDRYIEGTCPICGYPEARGDQCDNCGNQLDPTDLIDPRSKIDGSPPEFRETKHLFLDLPAFAERLPTWIEAQERLAPERQELLAPPSSTSCSRARSRATSTGACRSRSRATPTATTSGSTSGSTR